MCHEQCLFGRHFASSFAVRWTDNDNNDRKARHIHFIGCGTTHQHYLPARYGTIRFHHFLLLDYRYRRLCRCNDCHLLLTYFQSHARSLSQSISSSIAQLSTSSLTPALTRSINQCIHKQTFTGMTLDPGCAGKPAGSHTGRSKIVDLPCWSASTRKTFACPWHKLPKAAVADQTVAAAPVPLVLLLHHRHPWIQPRHRLPGVQWPIRFQRPYPAQWSNRFRTAYLRHRIVAASGPGAGPAGELGPTEPMMMPNEQRGEQQGEQQDGESRQSLLHDEISVVVESNCCCCETDTKARGESGGKHTHRTKRVSEWVDGCHKRRSASFGTKILPCQETTLIFACPCPFV